MKPRVLIVLVLLGVVLSLTAMAYAFPPDPTWVSGLYDDDDYDDVIITITSSVGVVDVLPLCEAHPVFGFLTLTGLSNEGPPSDQAASPYQTRAPPSV